MKYLASRPLATLEFATFDSAREWILDEMLDAECAVLLAACEGRGPAPSESIARDWDRAVCRARAQVGPFTVTAPDGHKYSITVAESELPALLRRQAE
jgi:hypothetical protein